MDGYNWGDSKTIEKDGWKSQWKEFRDIFQHIFGELKQISPDIYAFIQKLSVDAHKALGCRGVSRADFRLDDRPEGTGELVCLEVNTQPGMTATSLVPELAAHAGMAFSELVRWIVEDASCDR